MQQRGIGANVIVAMHIDTTNQRLVKSIASHTIHAMRMDSEALCSANHNNSDTRTTRCDRSAPYPDPICDSKTLWAQSLDLLRLQLDSLPIHEDALSFVRFWYPPLPDLRRELIHHFFFHPFQQYARRLRCACFHAEWNTEFDRMGIADLQ